MNRRHLLLLPPLGVLAACAASPPPMPEGPGISYTYLPKLRLNVASIDIDETRPNAGPTDVGRSLQPSAAEAVQIMGRDRLAAFGTQHAARFITVRAAILRERLPGQTGLFAPDPGERLSCTLTCRLEIRGANDLRLGFAEATVSRTAPSESNLAARERTVHWPTLAASERTVARPQPQHPLRRRQARDRHPPKHLLSRPHESPGTDPDDGGDRNQSGDLRVV